MATLDYKLSCYAEIDCQFGFPGTDAGTNLFRQRLDRKPCYPHRIPGATVFTVPDPESTFASTRIRGAIGQPWIAGPGTR